MESERSGNACIGRTLKTFRIWSMKLLMIHSARYRHGLPRWAVTLIGLHTLPVSMALSLLLNKRLKSQIVVKDTKMEWAKLWFNQLMRLLKIHIRLTHNHKHLSKLQILFKRNQNTKLFNSHHSLQLSLKYKPQRLFLINRRQYNLKTWASVRP